MNPSKTWTHIFFMGLLVVLASSGCATAQTSWDYNYKKFEKDTITVCTGHSPAHLTCQEYVR